jgi:hypothetical protein
MVYYDDKGETMNLMMERITTRRRFDDTNPIDYKIVKNFFQTYSWGPTGCPYILEVPWENIPDMLKDKITKKHLGIKN